MLSIRMTCLGLASRKHISHDNNVHIKPTYTCHRVGVARRERERQRERHTERQTETDRDRDREGKRKRQKQRERAFSEFTSFQPHKVTSG